MRHFREALCTRGITVHYRQLDEASSTGSLAKELTATVGRICPQELVMVEAGEWRVQQAIKTAAQKMGMKLEIRSDRHFFCSREEFAAHAKGRKQFRLEFFSREMRRKTGVLMKGGRPVGGAWNFDAENRESFGKDGPGELPRPTERCFRSSPPWLRFHVLTPGRGHRDRGAADCLSRKDAVELRLKAARVPVGQASCPGPLRRNHTV